MKSLIAAGTVGLALLLSGCTEPSAPPSPTETETSTPSPSSSPSSTAGVSVHKKGIIGEGCKPYGDINAWADMTLTEIFSQSFFSQHRKAIQDANVWEQVDDLWENAILVVPTDAAYSELVDLYLDARAKDVSVARRAIEDKIIPAGFDSEAAVVGNHATAFPGVTLKVSEEGNSLRFNTDATVVCGGIPVSGGRLIYIVDGVLLS